MQYYNTSNEENHDFQNEEGNSQTGESQQATQVGNEFAVDPNRTILVETLDGIIVPTKRCVLRICGFYVFDDSFRYSLNPKLYPILI